MIGLVILCTIAYFIWFYMNHESFVETITITCTHKQYEPATWEYYRDSDGNRKSRYISAKYYIWLRYKDCTVQINNQSLFNEIIEGQEKEMDCKIWINKNTKRLHSFSPIGHVSWPE